MSAQKSLRQLLRKKFVKIEKYITFAGKNNSHLWVSMFLYVWGLFFLISLLLPSKFGRLSSVKNCKFILSYRSELNRNVSLISCKFRFLLLRVTITVLILHLATIWEIVRLFWVVLFQIIHYITKGVATRGHGMCHYSSPHLAFQCREYFLVKILALKSCLV